ncbi:NUDIX domain-containing protein [Microbacterium sp. MPKO10]|uniref:NUDIX domain-containing protein n=1 Tax=Microbacterium sp. MPKO10 TaxID=2989818 RepID=UPI00223635DE|nr:NUDIX domain-containing protein [Microbacterium sp. MPKO10]MCW4458013.1 NUDIX domain-containing protein [Microbacterium sp. MPKO10]
MTDAYSGDRERRAGVALRSLGVVPLPDLERVTAVAVVPVDTGSGGIVGVQLEDRGLDIPGGHRQHEDADLEATARRECWEEAKIEIDDLRLIDVIESDYYGSAPQQLTYMVIYGAVISRLEVFSPSSESLGRELADPLDFLERYVAGDREMMGRWIATAIEELFE